MGRCKDMLGQFAVFLRKHGGEPRQIREVAYDISPALVHRVE